MTTTDEHGLGMVRPASRTEVEVTALVSGMPCICPASLVDLVRGLRSKLEPCGVDLSRPCSQSSDSCSCWILGFLPPLNRALHTVNIQLTEHAPGYLTLGSLQVKKEDGNLEVQLLAGASLAFFLLKTHRCVQRLALSESALLFKFPEVLASSIAAAHGLTDVKLSPPFVLQGEYSFVSVIAALREASAEGTHLDLSGFLLDDGGSKEMVQLLRSSCIRSLILSQRMLSRPAKRVLRALSSCVSLKRLSIDGFSTFSDTSAEFLASALAKNTTLSSLAVTGVTTKGADRILQALKENCSVEEFSLCSGASMQGSLFGSSLQEAAARLKSLRLSLVGLDSMCACSLADALEGGSCELEQLDLSGSSVDDLGASRLAQALVKNSTLKEVNLEWCRLTEKVVKLFVSSLAQNSTIKCVRLGSLPVDENLSFSPVERMVGRLITSWSTQGLQELARVLRRENCCVTTLELSWTKGAVKSCVSGVFQAMCENKHITELRVHYSGRRYFATGLISFLHNTESLRRLIVFHKSKHFLPFREVLLALSQNNTVTEAEFGDYILASKKDVSALETVLRFNQQLTSLTFSMHELEEKALRGLACSMIENHTMTELRFCHTVTDSRNYGLILETLNRNLSLLNQGIRFLRTGIFESGSLKAVRKLSDSHAFAVKYAMAENISVQAAKETIRTVLDRHGCPTD